MPVKGVSSLCVSTAIATTAVVVAIAVVEGAMPVPADTGVATSSALVRPMASRPQPPDGRELYATTCSACHQLDGSGLTDVYPPLAESEWVTGDEERLIKVVLHGLTGEVEVGGEIYSGAMPGWGSTLNDAQVAAVLTYVRKSWGNAAPAVVPATVAKIRSATAARATPWTAKELVAKTPPPN